MSRRLHSPRGSEEDPTQISLVESLRRATQQPSRQTRKPYSRGEEASSSRRRKQAAPHLPTTVPELGSPIAQLNSYFGVAEIMREYQPKPTRHSNQPESYSYDRPGTSDQEWSMTPKYSMSPATSVYSQPPPDSPVPVADTWIPFAAPQESYLVQQDIRIGYVPPHPNLVDCRYSQLAERTEGSGAPSNAIDEQIAEKYVYFDEPALLSPLIELEEVKVYVDASDLGALPDILSWEVVDDIDDRRHSAF